MTTADEAQALLATIDSAQRATRAARPSRALPLLVLGLVILGAMPFYVLDLARPDNVIETTPLLWSLGGFVGTAAGAGTAVYWLASLPVAYVFLAWWYRRASRRSGVAVSVRPLMITGLGLFALLVVALTQPFPGIAANLLIRGLSPLLPIAAGLVVWAVAERSRALLVVSLVFTAAAVSACLYDWMNVLSFLPWDGHWEYVLLPNLLLPASVLLVSAGTFAMVERRQGSSA